MTLKLSTVIILLIYSFGYSQIPSGYYNTASASGYTLKSQLKNIITNGHVDQGYSALYDAYKKTDTDVFFEKDNTVLDMYSENPDGKDPYNYNHGIRKCGNYNGENVCYNREHIFPQGFFNEKSPMRTDIHHVVPSDGSVNGRRSNFPFGEVVNASWTSSNGSKVGKNTSEGFTGTVFEPIDEFKGDIARMLFYFATRYENEVTSDSWDTHDASPNNPLNGTNSQVYEDWYIKLLYEWHTNDPVSEREIVRNNEAYKFQGNRNPFIDKPEYVAQIWGSILSTNAHQLLNKIKIYSNNTISKGFTVQVPNSIEITTITVYTIIGTKIFDNKKSKILNNKISVSNLNRGVYLLKLNTSLGNYTKKILIR